MAAYYLDILSEYLDAAMRRASYELLTEARSFYAEIPGFEGLFSGGKHQFMIRGERTLRIHNPHQADIGRELLSRLLRQAGVERDEWERL